MAKISAGGRIGQQVGAKSYAPTQLSQAQIDAMNKQQEIEFYNKLEVKNLSAIDAEIATLKKFNEQIMSDMNKIGPKQYLVDKYQENISMGAIWASEKARARDYEFSTIKKIVQDRYYQANAGSIDHATRSKAKFKPTPPAPFTMTYKDLPDGNFATSYRGGTVVSDKYGNIIGGTNVSQQSSVFVD